jgi:hypothetical protein
VFRGSKQTCCEQPRIREPFTFTATVSLALLVSLSWIIRQDFHYSQQVFHALDALPARSDIATLPTLISSALSETVVRRESYDAATFNFHIRVSLEDLPAD